MLLAVFIGLWTIGNGIPYGVDGIEIYFTYLIGHNGASVPHANPFLPDLAASPNAEAHPYYYTHHPNLIGHGLTQALIRAGVVDLRFHTLVAIGSSIMGLYLGACVLRAFVGPRAAIAYLTISSLHYAGVLVWAPVLLRGLHFLLFWGAVVLASRYALHPSPLRLIAIGGWSYLTFANDFTLGPFILLTIGVWLMVRDLPWRTRISALGAGVGGALLAVLTWLAILVGEFGTEVVVQDIAYTAVARTAGQRIIDRQAVIDFYVRNRIVFWNVLVDTQDFWKVQSKAWFSAFTLGHGLLSSGIYLTVIWVLAWRLREYIRARSTTVGESTGAVLNLNRLAAVFIVAVLVAAAIALGMGSREGSKFAAILAGSMGIGVLRTASTRLSGQDCGSRRLDMVAWLLGAAGCVLSLGILLHSPVAQIQRLIQGSHFAEFARSVAVALLTVGSLFVVSALVSLALTGGLIVRSGRLLAGAWGSVAALAGSIAFIASAFEYLAGYFGRLAAQFLSPIGGGTLDLARLKAMLLTGSMFDAHVVGGAPVAAVVVVVVGILVGRYAWRECWGRNASGDSFTCEAGQSALNLEVIDLLVGIAVAIAVMSMVAVGGFTTNFVATYKPALVFMEDVLLAVLLAHTATILGRWPRSSYRYAATLGILVAVGFYWINHQVQLLYRYPPHEIGAARVLAAEPYRGQSFVDESMYAAVWYYTRGIAHSVPWELNSDGRLDLTSLMFFRDRDAMRDTYLHPRFLTCVRQHTQAPYSCARWSMRLRSLGFDLKEGENYVLDKDFMIFLFPKTAEGLVGEEERSKMTNSDVSTKTR